MEKKEILALANKVCEGAKSMNDINAKYNDLKATYGIEVAKEVVDKAKALRKKDLAKIDAQRDAVVGSIDGERVLKAVFADLCKDRAYKRLCWEATKKCTDVKDLVANWYPHTIGREPARKVATEVEGQKKWTAREVTKTNAAGILIACIKNVAKSRKGQKSGTHSHEEGEICE